MLGIIRFVFSLLLRPPCGSRGDEKEMRRFEGILCNRTINSFPPRPIRISNCLVSTLGHSAFGWPPEHNPCHSKKMLNLTPRYRPCIIRLIMKKVRVIASSRIWWKGGGEKETEQLPVNYIGATRFRFFSTLSLLLLSRD